MTSRSDVIDLITATPETGVTILLPTHTTGADTRQDPIRFGNCLSEAQQLLEQSGTSPEQAESLLHPARALVDDHDFWQHQGSSLAVFVSEDGMRLHRLPLQLEQHVAVGARFHAAPLLPLASENEAALVLTVTASQARFYRATRDALHELDVDLPSGTDDDAAENDYEANAQASPPARPNTGSANISRAQVYGEGPPEWRETRLDDFVQKVERALEQETAAQKPPVVLVAGSDVIGRLRPSGLVTADVDLNPEALDESELHERAWQALQPTLEAARSELLDRYRALAGSGDDRGASRPGAVRKAASEGRVDALLVPRPRIERPDEELAELLADTVSTSGSIHLVDEEAELEHPVAILRY